MALTRSVRLASGVLSAAGVRRLRSSLDATPEGVAVYRLKRLLAVEGLSRPEPSMTVPATMADVLDDHVIFEVDCIDRMYLNLYQPKLMFPGGVVGFFKGHRQMPFASSALMDPMTTAFVKEIHRFIGDQGLDLVHFVKGQRKDDVAHEYLAGHDGVTEQILFVGRAQEKTRVYRTEKRLNPVTGKAYPWIVTATAMPNHFYFYGFDADFGPFFVKFCTYFPVRHEAPYNRVGWKDPPSACRSRSWKLRAA